MALHLPLIAVYNPIMAERDESDHPAPDYSFQRGTVGSVLLEDRLFWGEYGTYRTPTPLRVSIHDGMEIGIILSGAHSVTVDDMVLRGGPGDFWLLGMWEPHRWQARAADTQLVTVVFQPEFIGEEMLHNSAWPEMFACAPEDRPVVSNPQMRRMVLDIGRELHREMVERSRGWETAIRLSLARFLFTLTRQRILPSGRGTRAVPRSSTLERIRPALAAIHSSPTDRVTVADAAWACGLSTAQFSRVFRQATGLSFAKFRMRGHLALAAHLLLTTDLSTEAVAARSGFVDGSHLHRNFVERYGYTPGRYRELGE